MIYPKDVSFGETSRLPGGNLPKRIADAILPDVR